ncbi:hypothetical protein TrVE_jg8028 [Triparma verrucosa]|uniref:Uncharacterized protein n=1 Tax=Triparma verrucosa TaxID=1606542 RepID=A0A9W7C542_9STRA|nr:hypothetical protein TrVE_jg8028 [Triparma verrucosa]
MQHLSPRPEFGADLTRALCYFRYASVVGVGCAAVLVGVTLRALWGGVADRLPPIIPRARRQHDMDRLEQGHGRRRTPRVRMLVGARVTRNVYSSWPSGVPRRYDSVPLVWAVQRGHDHRLSIGRAAPRVARCA